MHAAALELAGLSGTYTLFDAADEDAARAVIQQLREGHLDGLNVTTPWKPLALASAEAWLRASTHRAGALTWPANTLRMDGPRLVATTTDGAGLTAALLTANVDLTHRSVLLLGAGGAGQAVAGYLLALGANDLVVANRTQAAAAGLAAKLAPLWPGRVRAHTWGQARGLAGVDVVVHATRAGHGQPAEEAVRAALAQDFAWLPWASWAKRPPLLVDLGYAPDLTPWQTFARDHGLPVDRRIAEAPIYTACVHPERKPPVGVLALVGQAMLAHQAARSFTVWTGARVDGQSLLARLLA